MAEPKRAKKTLYLRVDSLARIEAALSKMPGGGASLSAFLDEQLPVMATALEVAVDAWQRAGVQGLGNAAQNLIDNAIEQGVDVKRAIRQDLASIVEADNTPLFATPAESVVQSQPTKTIRTRSKKTPEVINDEKPKTIPPKQATSKRRTAQKK